MGVLQYPAGDIMQDKHLSVLEFHKVLDRLARQAAFSAGRELCLQLDVVSDLAEATRRQKETSEARALLAAKADVSLGGAHDVRPLLEKARRAFRLMPTDRHTALTGIILQNRILRIYLNMFMK